MNMLIGSGIGCPYRWLIKIRYIVTPARWPTEQWTRGRRGTRRVANMAGSREGRVRTVQDDRSSYFTDKRDWNFDGNYRRYLWTWANCHQVKQQRRLVDYMKTRADTDKGNGETFPLFASWFATRYLASWIVQWVACPIVWIIWNS